LDWIGSLGQEWVHLRRPLEGIQSSPLTRAKQAKRAQASKQANLKRINSIIKQPYPNGTWAAMGPHRTNNQSSVNRQRPFVACGRAAASRSQPTEYLRYSMALRPNTDVTTTNSTRNSNKDTWTVKIKSATVRAQQAEIFCFRTGITRARNSVTNWRGETRSYLQVQNLAVEPQPNRAATFFSGVVIL
jgi:hypothetical protein